ncbi:hypothetical protein QNO09_14585 [Streptomyces sp. 378]|nr:hypothetical protein [Streptomyces sp. 378]MDK1344515.1 hypothetical protein [Streptomyces sp. 378]
MNGIEVEAILVGHQFGVLQDFDHLDRYANHSYAVSFEGFGAAICDLSHVISSKRTQCGRTASNRRI